MVQINWTIQAKSDLRDISVYISKDSEKYAKLQILRIRHRTEILKSQMHIGKPVREIGQKNIRELLEGPYRIIYKIIHEEKIDILTVHHSSRDLGRRNIF